MLGHVKQKRVWNMSDRLPGIARNATACFGWQHTAFFKTHVPCCVRALIAADHFAGETVSMQSVGPSNDVEQDDPEEQVLCSTHMLPFCLCL